MKALSVSAALVMAAGMALAQTGQRPADDPLAVKPITSEASTTDTDMIRSKIERMGYTDVSRPVARQPGRLAREGEARSAKPSTSPSTRAAASRPNRSKVQSAAARCSIAAVAGRLAFRNVLMCRTASGIFSGVSFQGYMLTCELGASIATSIATA